MKRKLARLLLTLGVLLFSIAPEAHALTSLNQKSYYRISWNGLTLGRIRITASEKDGNYNLLVDTKSKGIANVFSPFETIASAEGVREDGRYIPRRYYSKAIRSDEGKNRQTEITYDSTGMILKRARTPLDDPSWRPEVPIAEINRAPDPVTAFLQMRHQLMRNVGQGIRETTVMTYDGRRYAGFTVNAIQAGTTLIDGEMKPVVHTVITRQPINGYTPKEWKKFKKGDPTVYAWFSADEAFIPLKIEISLMIGVLRIQLTEED